MTSIPLHSRVSSVPRQSSLNPLPGLLHTPSGLALLELQGVINIPDTDVLAESSSSTPAVVQIGRLDFPDYRTDADLSSMVWMKRVHLYVGHHQRLAGEVRKLAKPLAIVRRVGSSSATEDPVAEAVEIVDIVRYKLVFSDRPEPVGLAAS
ncbi:hypothetical protein VTK73DRAFT_96 [Phialemonium thermophilum]|uniref:Chromosome transmission fidelity protein 8 n=1 Tax=Phialemonium thermophilum TaxID=223376 RepID=A0ABR3Y410_9PEZI